MKEIFGYISGKLKIDNSGIKKRKEELIEAINKIAPKELKEEEVEIRACLLASTQVTSYFGRFTEEELKRIAEHVTDKAVMVGHNTNEAPIAHTFLAEIIKVDGQPWVKVWFYWMKESSFARDLAINIDGGIYKEVSFHFIAKDTICDICGKDIRNCQHIPGNKYNENICTFRWENIISITEISLVHSGAMLNTRIFTNEQTLLNNKEMNYAFEEWNNLNKKSEKIIIKANISYIDENNNPELVISSSIYPIKIKTDFNLKLDKNDTGKDIILQADSIEWDDNCIYIKGGKICNENFYTGENDIEWEIVKASILIPISKISPPQSMIRVLSGFNSEILLLNQSDKIFWNVIPAIDEFVLPLIPVSNDTLLNPFSFRIKQDISINDCLSNNNPEKRTNRNISILTDEEGNYWFARNIKWQKPLPDLYNSYVLKIKEISKKWLKNPFEDDDWFKIIAYLMNHIVLSENYIKEFNEERLKGIDIANDLTAFESFISSEIQRFLKILIHCGYYNNNHEILLKEKVKTQKGQELIIEYQKQRKLVESMLLTHSNSKKIAKEKNLLIKNPETEASKVNLEFYKI